MTMTDEELYDGSIAHRLLGDGRVLVLYEMIYNVRLCVGPHGEPSYDRGFCYDKDDFGEALKALATWDGNDWPPGPVKKEAGARA